MNEVLEDLKRFFISAKLDRDYNINGVKTMNDMFILLSDGKILSDLMKTLFGQNFWESINYIDSSTNRSKENIKEFIDGCRNLCQIPENDIFKPNDLIEGENMNAVFYTLSKVSQTEQSERKNFSCFICPKNSEPVKNKLKFLSYIDETKETLSSCEQFLNNSENSLGHDSFSDVFMPKPVTCSKKVTKKYEYCVQELLGLEVNYLTYHLMLLSNIYDYLSLNLTFSELTLLFSNFQNLKNAEVIIFQSFYKNHYDLHKSLGATVIEYKSRFLEYVPYVSKLENANIYSDKIWKDPYLKSGILNSVKAFDPKYRLFDLRSVLTIPMQHVTRYPLHFNEMLKNCQEDEKMRTELQTGLDEIIDILNHINQSSTDEIEVGNIQELQTRFTPFKKSAARIPNLKEFGHIKFQGEFNIVYLKRLKKKRIVILFDTTILIAKSCGSKLKLTDEISFQKCNFNKIFNSNGEIERVTFKAKDLKDFSKNFAILFGNICLRDPFLHSLDQCILKNNIEEYLSKNHDLKIVTFDSTTSCSICKKILTGRLSQGYKCKNEGCDISAHYECLAHLKPCCCEKPGSSSQECGSNKKENLDDDPFYDSSHSITVNESINSNSCQSIVPEERDLSQAPWFLANIDTLTSIELLSNMIDGSYLVGTSGGIMESYFISFKYYDKIRHIKVKHQNGYYINECRTFPTLMELIGYYQLNSMVEINEQYDVSLLNPAVESNNIKLHSICDNFVQKKGFLQFKAGEALTLLSDLNEHIWVIKSGEKVGYCYSFMVQKDIKSSSLSLNSYVKDLISFN